MACDPGTASRAWSPERPPNQAICTWLFLNAVTDAAYVLSGANLTSTPSLELRYAATLSKRSRRRASLSSGMAVKTNGLAYAVVTPPKTKSASAASQHRWILIGVSFRREAISRIQTERRQ